jgi:hypothetical protein
MRRRPSLVRPLRPATLALAIAACTIGAAPAPALALNPIKPICGVVGWFSGIAGKTCGVLQHGDKLIGAGKKLLTGHVGGAAKTLLGGGGPKPSTVIGLAAIGTWVLVGAKASLHETAKLIGQTTSPQLGTTWFSSTYWRMTALAAILTLPFLFAAAVQAMIRSDLALLARAALGYLPLAMLAVSVAAPLTMLLLAASDQMSAIVSSAARDGGVRFLQRAGFTVGALSVLDGSPFLAFLVGLFTAAGAIVLWVELLMRQAAVYVVVLMLPLAFSAFVWPARRIWAIRAVELLVALILSKFAIVAVLSLAGAALGQTGAGGVESMLTGMVLVALGAFAPWALLRLLPLAELASGAAGQLRGEVWRLRATRDGADAAADRATEWAGSVTSGMQRLAGETSQVATNRSLQDGDGAELTKLTAMPAPGAPERNGAAATNRSDAGGDVLSSAVSSAVAVGGDGGGGREDAVDDDVLASARGGVDPNGPGASSERLPGLGEIWQAPDMSWRPLVLGLDEGWPPAPLWPPGDGAGADPGPAAGDAPGGGASDGPSDQPGDDHDPLPPRQDPEGGRL